MNFILRVKDAAFKADKKALKYVRELKRRGVQLGNTFATIYGALYIIAADRPTNHNASSFTAGRFIVGQ